MSNSYPSMTWAQTMMWVLRTFLNLVVTRTVKVPHLPAALMRVIRVCQRKDLIKSVLYRTTNSFIIWGKKPINRLKTALVEKIKEIKRALYRRWSGPLKMLKISKIVLVMPQIWTKSKKFTKTTKRSPNKLNNKSLSVWGMEFGIKILRVTVLRFLSLFLDKRRILKTTTYQREWVELSLLKINSKGC